MNYRMTATTNDSGEDVFRLFKEDNSWLDVGLTTDEGTLELKRMFSEILTSLIRDGEAEISYIDTSSYKNGMYKEVCEEYVKVLAAEVEAAKKGLGEEGLLEVASPS